MGTSSSSGELVVKITKLAGSIDNANRDTLDKSAFVVKNRVLSEVGKAIGGDHSMGSKKVGVRYKVTPKQADIKATGPMHWLERGVKPHAIAPKGAGGSRAARSSFVSNAFGSGPISFGRGRIGTLQFESGEVRPYARRAGRFPAKRSWSNGVDASRKPVQLTFRQVHVKNMASIFG